MIDVYQTADAGLCCRRSVGAKPGSWYSPVAPTDLGEKRPLHLVGAMLRRTRPGGECGYDARMLYMFVSLILGRRGTVAAAHLRLQCFDQSMVSLTDFSCRTMSYLPQDLPQRGQKQHAKLKTASSVLAEFSKPVSILLNLLILRRCRDAGQ